VRTWLERGRFQNCPSRSVRCGIAAHNASDPEITSNPSLDHSRIGSTAYFWLLFSRFVVGIDTVL
jgi:hypothetical protein